MKDLLDDIKRLQGIEEKRNWNLLPRAVLVFAAIALVAAMVMRLPYKYDRHEPFHFKPAVLVKKLSDSSSPAPLTVPAAADAEKNVAPHSDAAARAIAAPSPEGSDRAGAFRPGPPEQPDLEKAIDMLMQRRSPKY